MGRSGSWWVVVGKSGVRARDLNPPTFPEQPTLFLLKPFGEKRSSSSLNAPHVFLAPLAFAFARVDIYFIFLCQAKEEIRLMNNLLKESQKKNGRISFSGKVVIRSSEIKIYIETKYKIC